MDAEIKNSIDEVEPCAGSVLDILYQQVKKYGVKNLGSEWSWVVLPKLVKDSPRNEFFGALNRCYIQDGKVWVRGGGSEPDFPDVTLYDFIRNVVDSNGAKIDTSLPNEELDEALSERLFDGPEEIEGLIALLWSDMWALAELRERLKAYEQTGLTPKEILQLKKESGKEIE